MQQIARGQAVRVGVDLTKGVIQVHAVDGAGQVLTSRTLARLVVQQAQAQWRELDAHLAWCDARIAAHAKDNPAVKKAATLIGIGTVGASARRRRWPRWATSSSSEPARSSGPGSA